MATPAAARAPAAARLSSPESKIGGGEGKWATGGNASQRGGKGASLSTASSRHRRQRRWGAPLLPWPRRHRMNRRGGREDLLVGRWARGSGERSWAVPSAKFCQFSLLAISQYTSTQKHFCAFIMIFQKGATGFNNSIISYQSVVKSWGLN